MSGISASRAEEVNETRKPDSFYGIHDLELDGPLDIPVIPPPTPPHHILTCTLELRGFMADHLDFVARFAQHMAHAMNLPCSDPIHLPNTIRRWFMNKGPFAHGKTKEIFERKTAHRVLQIFDGNKATVDAWVEYLRRNVPAGVEIKVDRYDWVEVPKLVDGKVERPESKAVAPPFEDRVRALAQQYVDSFTGKGPAPDTYGWPFVPGMNRHVKPAEKKEK
ncbi:mitochondrial 37S ribosomal protein rsm10 [Borealophlyctis nickersoniae]|nr:mitochondrial 37S ribosomal protein rsm10 [Borealophlyctis nickersoniae]